MIGAIEPVELVRADAVEKTYHDGERDLQVLRGVSVTVRAGDVVAIVGASGSGKSTLLHMLGGLDWPSGGQVWLNGKETRSLSKEGLAKLRRQASGFVFQFHHLLHEFSAIENIMLPMMANGVAMKAAEQRAADLLAQVGLQDRAKHRPGQLSGGEQQRVAIARAMSNGPSLILADEPTGNLDEVTGGRVADLLFSLVEPKTPTAAPERAVVLVTHNEALARRAHRTLELRQGLLVAKETGE